jgi:hypothetical protein
VEEVSLPLLKVGIVGSRSRNTPKDKDVIRQVLKRQMTKYKIHIVSGGCPKGADKFAEELAEELNLGISVHPPDKSQLPENYTRYDYARICYERNSTIADESQILLAIWDGISGGTADTINKVKEFDKPIVIL